MTQLRRFLPLVVLTLLCACASPDGTDGIQDRRGHLKPGDPSKISLGMTRLEVMKTLGKPESVSAEGNTERLFYVLERPWWQDKPFKIQLIEGKVVSFGVIESNK